MNESRRDSLLREDSRGPSGSRPGRDAPDSVSLLIHTRLVHGCVRLSPQARTRLDHRNINNVLLNGTIDFDLLIKRLTGDGSWSEDHLILVERKKTLPFSKDFSL